MRRDTSSQQIVHRLRSGKKENTWESWQPFVAAEEEEEEEDSARFMPTICLNTGVPLPVC